MDFLALAHQCAPHVSPQTMAAVVGVESTYNPFAIGVVGGRLARQPTSKAEAVATATALAAKGWNFSLGVAQVNQANLPKYSLSYEDAFDPCLNLQVGSKILADCYGRALQRTPANEQAALRASFSCYYSGNFQRGFVPDKPGALSYVQKVVAQAGAPVQPIPVVPDIKAQRPGAPIGAPAAAASASPPQAAPPAEESMVITGQQQQTAPSAPAQAAADGPVKLKRAVVGASSPSTPAAPGTVPTPVQVSAPPSTLIF